MSSSGLNPDSDIVVIGAGGAGLTCAICAAEMGARVHLLDRNARPGGTFWIANGTFSAANSRLTDPSVGDSPDRMFADAMRIGDGLNDPSLLRKYVENAGPTLDWLLDNGLELTSQKPRYAPELELMDCPRTYDAVGRAQGYLRVLLPLLDKHMRSGHIVLSPFTRATGMKQQVDGSWAVGAEREGHNLMFRAESVVLAGGGYGHNRGMIAHYNQGFEKAITSCAPHADGSVIRLGLGAGAELVHMNWLRANPGSLQNPGSDWRVTAKKLMVMMRAPFISGALWVNCRGRRVIDEDSYTATDKMNLSENLPDKTVYVLFDSEVQAGMTAPPIVAQRDLGNEPTTYAWDWANFARVDWQPGVFRQVGIAESVDELAAKMGIYASTLRTTVAKWNECVESGVDPEFGRKPVHRFMTPPFYCIKARATIPLTMGGVRVDANCRALCRTGEPIAGLYAIGESMGCGQLMGKGLVSGFGNGGAMVLGRLVGRSLGLDAAR